jgi:hypothetical protein
MVSCVGREEYQPEYLLDNSATSGGVLGKLEQVLVEAGELATNNLPGILEPRPVKIIVKTCSDFEKNLLGLAFISRQSCIHVAAILDDMVQGDMAAEEAAEYLSIREVIRGWLCLGFLWVVVGVGGGVVTGQRSVRTLTHNKTIHYRMRFPRP